MSLWVLLSLEVSASKSLLKSVVAAMTFWRAQGNHGESTPPKIRRRQMPAASMRVCQVLHRSCLVRHRGNPRIPVEGPRPPRVGLHPGGSSRDGSSNRGGADAAMYIMAPVRGPSKLSANM
jgi:hypothetical protein